MTKLGIYLLMYILIKLTCDLVSLSWMSVSSEGRYCTEKNRIERCGCFHTGAGQWRRWRANFFLESTRHIPSFSVMETDRLPCSFSVSRAGYSPFLWPAKDNCSLQPGTKCVALLCVPQGWDSHPEKFCLTRNKNEDRNLFSTTYTLISCAAGTEV